MSVHPSLSTSFRRRKNFVRGQARDLARGLVCAAVVAGAVNVAPAPVMADPVIEVVAHKGRSLDQAKQFIIDLAQRSMILLHEPNRSLDQRQQAFRELWGGGVAFKTISRFVLGRYWRGASEEQRERYVALFQESIMRTSETVLASFTDEQLRVTGGRLAGKKDMLISTRLVRERGPAVPVDWRVRIIDGRHQIVDVVIEGVSMALTKRSEYSSVVKNRGLEGLLTALQPTI